MMVSAAIRTGAATAPHAHDRAGSIRRIPVSLDRHAASVLFFRSRRP